MHRALQGIALALALAVSVGSCTCNTESPPPVAPTRAPGFQAALATPSRTAPPSAPTPTAAPTQPAATVAPSENVAIPADFPSEVSVFQGATVTAVQDLAAGAHNVLFTSAGKPEEIFAFYQDDLKQKGFQVTQQYQAPEQSFLSFKKGQLVTNVIIAPDPRDKSKRVIGIMYQIEEEVEEF